MPLNLLPGPIGAGAASRNRAVWMLATLLAACGTPEPEANGDETVVRADDGVWEQLPIGTRVRVDGTLAGAFENGARVEIGRNFCAHLAMTRREWDGLMQTARPGQRVTVYGSKAPGPATGACPVQLDHVGLVAR